MQTSHPLRPPHQNDDFSRSEKLPLVTIVISTLNAEATLEKCLGSIFSQIYPHIEIIIADGLSNDRTMEIVRQHAREGLRWISEPDRGIYDAWNKALPISKGDWLYFLGADDVLFNDRAIQHFVDAQAELKEKPFLIYGDVLLATNFGMTKRVGLPWRQARKLAGRIMPIPHQGVFHSKKLFELTGEFDRSYRIAADYKKVLQAIKLTDPVYIPGWIVAARGNEGVSSQLKNRLRAMRENERARRELGVSTHPLFKLDLLKAHVWSILAFAATVLRR